MRRNKTCGLSKDHTVTKERWQEPALETGEASDAFDVCPAIRRFVQTNALQLQVDPVMVVVDIRENPERLGGKIFHGRNTVQHDGLVVGHLLKKASHDFIACIDD